MKKILKFILPAVLIALTAVFALSGCGGSSNNDGEYTEVDAVGYGEVQFYLEVTDANGDTTRRMVFTDHGVNLGEVLLGYGLIQGDEGSFGLMVTHVDSIRADFTLDNAWWALYVDGEMSMLGVSGVYPEEGVVYAFVHTPA